MTNTTLAAPADAKASNATSLTSTRWALVSLAAAAVLPSLNTSVANAALPTLAGAFSVSFHTAQWIVLSYLLATTTLIVSAGRLGDLAGRKRLLVAGIVTFTAGSVVSGLAPSLWLLILGRVVQGAGAALMIPLTLALVGETVPPGSTGRTLGLLGTMSALGTALGPSLGGVLVHLFDWRAVFLVNAPLGALTAYLVHRHLPADAARRRVRFDYAGTLLLAVALVAYALAMTAGSGRLGGRNVALLLAAFVALGVFMRVEVTAASPLVSPAWLREPGQRSGLVLSALVATVMMTTLAVGPFHLSVALGLDVVKVGVFLSAGPLAAALVGVPAGRLVDALGAARVVQLGLSGMVAGCFSLSVLPPTLGVGAYVLPLVVVTAGYALFQTANNAAVLTGVSMEARGMASGCLNLSRNLGLITGGSAMAAIFAAASATNDVAAAVPAAVATGTRITFAVATLLTTAALILAGKRRTSSGQ